MSPLVQGKAKIAGEGVGSIDPRTFGLTKAAYSVNETLEVLSIGRTSLYKLVSGGELSQLSSARRRFSVRGISRLSWTKLQEAA